MSFGRIAFLLFAVPFVLLVSLWLCYRFYNPEAAGPVSFLERDFRYYSDDGRGIDGTLAIPTQGTSGGGDARTPFGAGGSYVVLVPDRGLDRDWNSNGVYFRTGQRLARYWASRGVAVVRFDSRGTGGEAGPRRHFSLLSQAEDLAAVIRGVENTSGKNPSAAPAPRVTGRGAVVVAHGEGCLTALIGVRARMFHPRALFLVGCGFVGTYLEAWGRLILANMRAAGAGALAVEAAEARMVRFLREPILVEKAPLPPAPGRAPEGKRASGAEKNPDLAGFERALEFLRSPASVAWTREAARLSFVSELRAALGQGISVTLCFPQFDDELEPGTAGTLRVALGPRPGLAARVLPSANHFVKTQHGAVAGSLGRALARVTPFSHLSPELLGAVLTAAGSDSPGGPGL